MGLPTIDLRFTRARKPRIAGTELENHKPVITVNERFVRANPKEVIAVVIAHEVAHLKYKHKYQGSHHKVKGKQKKKDIQQENQAWRFAGRLTKGVKVLVDRKEGTGTVMVKRGKRLFAYVL
jgi:predicted SprT family Zn-dependent metalloprotease